MPEAERTVVFVNRFFYPDQSATSQMLSDLAFGLAAKGYHVKVVASAQSYCGDAERLPAHEVVNGVEIYRVRSPAFGRRSLLGKVLAYLLFLLLAPLTLLRIVRAGDIVVAKTDPPMLGVAVAPVVWLRGAKLVNWWQDVFPEVAQVVAYRWRSLVPLFAFLRLLRRLPVRVARMNVVIGERMHAHMLAQGLAEKRLTVIPNWSDGEIVSPRHSGAELRRQWGLEGHFVVGYSGNLGRAHDSRAIVEAIDKLERGGQAVPGGRKITWLFIGGGTELRVLQKELSLRGLKSAMFKDYQPRELLGESLAVADVHLVSLRPELEGLIVPSKFYGIAAASRPTIFIGSEGGEIARILAAHKCGVTVAERDSDALLDAVLGLAADPTAASAMGARARRLFERRYDKAIALGEWHATLTQLTVETTAREGSIPHARAVPAE